MYPATRFTSLGGVNAGDLLVLHYGLVDLRLRRLDTVSASRLSKRRHLESVGLLLKWMFL